MAKRVTHTAFDAMHPAVPALYACITLGLTMAAVHPVLVAISCAGAFAYIACVRGLRSAVCALRWQIPVMLVIALVNPLFVRMGSTVVLELFGRQVFLESLLYGLAMAGMFVASVQWFAACSHMLTHDKVLALFGSAAPVVALMISMTMRLVPRFLRQGRTIAAVQDVARSCFVADGRAGLPARVADSCARVPSLWAGRWRIPLRLRRDASSWVGRAPPQNDLRAVPIHVVRRCGDRAAGLGRGCGGLGCMACDGTICVLSPDEPYHLVVGLRRIRGLDACSRTVAYI